MVRSVRHSLWMVVLLACVCGTVHGGAAQWEFNGSLESSTGGAALTAEAGPPAASSEVTFTTATINGNLARVAGFSRGTFFRMVHGGSPNGGGAHVNKYTLIIDVMFPDRSPSDGWASLWQTDTANGDDGDWFIDDEDGVGISGTYGGSVPAGEWHRLALVPTSPRAPTPGTSTVRRPHR